MRPIRAYQASLYAQEQTRIEIPNIPPSSPKNAAIYLPEVDATQPPSLLGGGDCVANYFRWFPERTGSQKGPAKRHIALRVSLILDD